MTKKYFTDINFLKMFLFISVFLVGGYHLAVSCFLSVLLMLFLIYKSLTQKDFCKIKPNAVLFSIGIIVVSYLVVTLWAVDKGTAIYGFFKVLPVGLFTVVFSIYSKETRNEIVEIVPYAAIANGVVSYILSFVPSLSDYFLIADRLGGFFQSPNAFAIYCLVGIIILLTSEKINVKKLILTAILVVLIFLSGSRTVFIFLLVAIVVLFFNIKNKKIKLTVLGIVILMIAVSVIVVAVTGSFQTVGRFLTISLESSTFLGRILYYIDAIPQILKHPFGLGYYGYYFTQGSFQTGVYSVVFVHNSLLQFCLDVGIVPALCFASIITASFFSKNTKFRQRLIIFVLFGHSLFDFDLEFTAVFLVLILMLDFDVIKTKSVEFNTYALTTISVVLILLNVYFGLINTLYLKSEFKAVDKIYGHDSMSKLMLITEETNSETVEKYADQIIEENGHLAIAYSAKANSAYSKGDFKKVIEYKKKAIACIPYSIAEYDDYCQKLVVGISLYNEVNDEKSVSKCIKELVNVGDMLEEVKGNTHPIAWKIQDKPQLELSGEYKILIEEYKNSEEQ